MLFTLHKADLVTKVFCSGSIDPWYNLALEEYLLDNIKEDEILLYLWQNKDTVVIGRNQNPWKECRCRELENDGGHLARRLSGGGAVFHDLGNLNFTFLMNKKYYDLDKQLKVILNAVRNQGLDAKFTGRNDLVLNGKKFSGNAFYYKKQSAYHHGTILIDSDLTKLIKYLQVSKEKIESKGVKSVKSRVTNLIEYSPDLNIQKMADAFMEAFIEEYGGEKDVLYNVDWIDQKELKELYKKYSSWEWRFGESPKFDISLETRFEWGEIQIGLKLQDAQITDVKIYSDALDEEFIGILPEIFMNKKFNSRVLSESLKKLKVDDNRIKMIDDISDWIIDKEF